VDIDLATTGSEPCVGSSSRLSYIASFISGGKKIKREKIEHEITQRKEKKRKGKRGSQSSACCFVINIQACRI
jgi:hypothetical protein